MRKIELIDLRNCLPGVLLLLVFCGASSQCRGFGLHCVIVVFLVILTYFAIASEHQNIRDLYEIKERFIDVKLFFIKKI